MVAMKSLGWKIGLGLIVVLMLPLVTTVAYGCEGAFTSVTVCPGGGWSGSYYRDPATGAYYVAPGANYNTGSCCSWTCHRCSGCRYNCWSPSMVVSRQRQSITFEEVEEGTSGVTSDLLLTELNKHTYGSFEGLSERNENEVKPFPFIASDIPDISVVPTYWKGVEVAKRPVEVLSWKVILKSVENAMARINNTENMSATVTGGTNAYIKITINETKTESVFNATTNITETKKTVVTSDRYFSGHNVVQDLHEGGLLPLRIIRELRGTLDPRATVASGTSSYTFSEAGRYFVQGGSEFPLITIDLPLLNITYKGSSSIGGKVVKTWTIKNTGTVPLKAEVSTICPTTVSCGLHDFLYGTIPAGETRSTTVISGSSLDVGVKVIYDDAYGLTSISPKSIESVT